MTTETPPPPTTRWKKRILIALGVLVALVWATPRIVSVSPLLGWASSQASQHLNGSVEIGRASLGWFAPVVLGDVVVRDCDNRVVARIARIETDQRLFSLLLESDDLGGIHIDKPHFDWTFGKTTSNLETVLAKLVASHDKPNEMTKKTTLPRMHLEIAHGTIDIRDADSPRVWQVTEFSLIARVQDGGKSVQILTQGSTSDNGENGSFKAEVFLTNPLAANPKATIKSNFTSLPIGPVGLFVRRTQPTTELAGTLRGHLLGTASLLDGQPKIELVADLIGANLAVRAPFLADHLKIDRLAAPCSIRLEDQRLTAERLEVQCDLGKISAQGSINLARSGLAMLDRADVDVNVELNLATLAERLPKTVHLHDDVKLISGNFKARCLSQMTDGQIVWQGKINASDIRGIRGTQALTWSDPVAVEMQLRNLHQSMPTIDRLKCTSRFLNIEANQVANRFTMTAEADLQQFAEPLSQFVDLAGVQLAGTANATVHVRRLDDERFIAEGETNLRDLFVAGVTKSTWQEAAVTMTFGAAGHRSSAGRQSLDAGEALIGMGVDRVTMKLTEPIADLARGPWGAVQTRIEGDLARWQNRARSLTTAADDWKLSGQAKLDALVRPARDAIDCKTVQLHATPFRCSGANLWIDEPTLNLQGDAGWNLRSGEIALAKVNVACPSVIVRSDRLTLNIDTLKLHGGAEFTGDLARLRQWTHNPNAKPTEPMSGTIAGRIDLQSAKGRHGAEFNVAVKQFAYGPVAKPTWREPELRCQGRGVIDSAKDGFQIDKLTLTTSVFTAEMLGTIAGLSATRNLDLTGTLSYDLEKLEPQLKPFLGKDAKIAGKDTRGFKLSGPLFPRTGPAVIAVSGSGQSVGDPMFHFNKLQGEASVGWKSLTAFGCVVGPADVKAVMQQGWLQTYPIDTTINMGKLRLQPNLRLEPEPMEIVLLAGPVVERAQITPAMCASALGYALPILANVTEAEGAVSLSLSGGRIPLANPTTGEVKGTLVLHAAKIGPSAIIRELSGLLKLPPPQSLVKETQVAFHMVQGKVHHQNLELVFPDFTLKSSGTVGLDGSLALVLEMPVPAKLAEAARLTPAQAQQLIRIPVGGTLDRPQLDPRALESLTSILGRSFLENQLNKLLQPKR